MEAKKKIIYTLVVFTVLLLLLNIVIGMFCDNEGIVISNDDISRIEIEKTFRKVLKNFGIKDNWITERNNSNRKLDSVKVHYKVNIPPDVPIPMLLKELSYKFKHQKVQVTSKEKNNFGSANLKIKSGKYIKLIADLNYKKELVRPSSSIAFIIKDIESLNEDELVDLFNTPLQFAALLPLRTESVSIAEKILKSKRNYYLLLDDDADNVKFELDEELNVNNLKKNIKSIVSSFNSPRYFFVSRKGTGFSKNFINYLKEEFKQKGRKVLNLSLFINLKGENEADLNSLLSFHLNRIKPGDSKTFFIDIDDWGSIKNNINSFLKKGNKLKLPTQL